MARQPQPSMVTSRTPIWKPAMTRCSPVSPPASSCSTGMSSGWGRRLRVRVRPGRMNVTEVITSTLAVPEDAASEALVRDTVLRALDAFRELAPCYPDGVSLNIMREYLLSALVELPARFGRPLTDGITVTTLRQGASDPSDRCMSWAWARHNSPARSSPTPSTCASSVKMGHGTKVTCLFRRSTGNCSWTYCVARANAWCSAIATQMSNTMRS